jgi:RNA-directed DNA polymerase
LQHCWGRHLAPLGLPLPALRAGRMVREGRSPPPARQAFVIRYADDFVIGVAREDDAKRIMDVSPKRMSKYGLTVHPEKTRLVRFQPRRADDSETEERDPPEPRTFDFPGFTHYWGRSQRGVWVVKRKTAKNRRKRTLAALAERCRKNVHLPIRAQHQKLTEKLVHPADARA